MSCLKSDKQVVNTTNSLIISVVGLDDSGKSTTVKVLKGDKTLDDVQPTVGYEPHEMKYDHRDITLYDLGGGARVRDIWKHYVAESYGFVYVIDASNRHRLNEARLTLNAFIENEKVHRKPILILANKQDQASAMDESELVQHFNLEEIVNRYHVPCRVELCIANSGVGKKMDQSLKTGFDWLVKYIGIHFEELQSRIEEDVKKQRHAESLVRREKSDRLRSTRKDDRYEDDIIDDPKENPFKRLAELSLKDSKSKTPNSTAASNSAYLTAGERKLIEEMDTRSRLSTINEEKSKFKGFRNNKLVPLEDPKKNRSKYDWD